jgi:hypothetical protein
MAKPGDMAKADNNAIYNTASHCYPANRPPAAFDKAVNYDCDFGVCLAATEEGSKPTTLLKLCPLFADTYGRCNRDRIVANIRFFARPTGTECAHKKI